MGSRLAVMDLAAHERRGFDVARAVRGTLLGCPAAKSVLLLLGECSDAAGVAFPSRERIARETDWDLRTVHRAIQCLREIGLVTVVKISRAEQRELGKLQAEEFHLTLAMLGRNLTEEFGQIWRAAQAPRTRKSVSQTVEQDAPKSVCQTVKSVCQTLPPAPLLGGTTKELPIPPNPPRGNTPEERDVPDDPLAGEAWRQVQLLLAREVGVQSFTTWLRPTRGVAVSENVLQVRVPSAHFLHLSDRYGGQVRDALTALGLPLRDVRFVAPEPMEERARVPVPVLGLRPARRET